MKLRLSFSFGILLLFFSSIFASSVTAQEVVLLEKTWGGTSSDSAKDVALDPSSNIYVTGTTYTFGVNIPDVFLLRYDPSGNLVWQRTWGGPKYDEGLSIATDPQGNIYVTGATDSFFPRESDAFLLKFNPSGNLLWQRTWGGDSEERGESLAIDGQGNIYIAGTTHSITATGDAFLLKFDSSGNLAWQRSWGGREDDFGRGVAIDSQGNIYMTGYTSSYGDGVPNIFLLKFNSLGDLLWQKTWGGNGVDYAFGLAVSPTGDAYVTGYTTSVSAGSGDPFLLRIDSTGSLVWQRTWGGKADDEGLRVALNPAGHIFIAGWTDSFGAGGRDIFLLRYDSDGSIALQKTWGGSKRDWGYGLAADNFGRAYVVGLVTEGPPYALGSPTGVTKTPTFSLGTPTAAPVSSTFATGIPTGTVTEPSGSETYAGGADAFLLKYGPLTPSTTTTAPTTTTTTTTTTPATTTTTEPTTTTTSATTTTTPTPTAIFNSLSLTILLMMATLALAVSRRKTRTLR